MGMKSAAAAAAVRLGADDVGRRLNRASVAVLAYHNVLRGPSGGDRSLHLDFDAFRRQIDHVQDEYEVVPIGAVGSRPSGPGPAVAITFDDAYRGAVQTALPELHSRGLPATVFVAPGILGSGGMWWDRLADPVRGLDAEVRRHALEIEHGDQERVIHWAASQGLEIRELGAELGIATEEEVRAVAAGTTVSVGAHSWGHLDLSCLRAEALRREMSEPRVWLEEHLPQFTPWLAYPYGLHSATARDAAADAGYAGALAVDGGLARSNDPRHALPRINVPAGMGLDVFRLKLSGLLP